MVCPNCKLELKEGMLYCENCGEEIKMVPEFDTDVEHEIQMTLNSVASDLKEELDKEQKQDKTNAEELFMEDEHFVSRFLLGKLKQRFPLVLTLCLFFAICVVIVWFYSLSLHKNSFEYQTILKPLIYTFRIINCNNEYQNYSRNSILFENKSYNYSLTLGS